MRNTVVSETVGVIYKYTKPPSSLLFQSQTINSPISYWLVDRTSANVKMRNDKLKIMTRCYTLHCNIESYENCTERITAQISNHVSCWCHSLDSLLENKTMHNPQVNVSCPYSVCTWLAREIMCFLFQMDTVSLFINDLIKENILSIGLHKLHKCNS